MVEVFKTNIEKAYQTNMILERLKKLHRDYKVNFDLDDCDNILRVESKEGIINSEDINDLIKAMGFQSEVLSDESVKR